MATDSLRSALEDALVADPDDLAAHSAYADYLAEQGDPRGEFIQVQLALENPGLPPAERTPLEERERELLTKHRREWLGSLATWMLFSLEDEPRSFVRFRRGWVDRARVDRLTVQTGRCLANAAELRLLRSLVILDCRREQPYTHYTVPADSPGVDEGSPYPGLSVLAHATNLGNVRVLGLGDVEGDCQFRTYPDAEHLPAAAAKMPRLRELHLNARLGESTLLDAPFLSELHTLRLDRVRLGDDGALALARRKWPNLRVLQIWNGRVGDRGAARLSKLKSLRSLELLDVSFNYLTVAGVEALKTLGVPVVADYQMPEADDIDDDEDDEFELDLE